MIITVKRCHINKGKRGSCKACPIALAIKEQTNFYVSVGLTRINLYEQPNQMNLVKTISLPKCVANFISNFDDNLDVKPFEFELKI